MRKLLMIGAVALLATGLGTPCRQTSIGGTEMYRVAGAAVAAPSSYRETTVAFAPRPALPLPSTGSVVSVSDPFAAVSQMFAAQQAMLRQTVVQLAAMQQMALAPAQPAGIAGRLVVRTYGSDGGSACIRSMRWQNAGNAGRPLLKISTSACGTIAPEAPAAHAPRQAGRIVPAVYRATARLVTTRPS